MQSHLLEEALKVITSPQILVNVISRRVKQLTAGHRPLIEVTSARMGFSDIALSEVIGLKLSYEMIAAPEVVAPGVITPFAAKKSGSLIDTAMAFDFNEARAIVEAAKKRGVIRAEGEEAPQQAEGKKGEAGGAVLPEWLREGLLKPAPPVSPLDRDDRDR